MGDPVSTCSLDQLRVGQTGEVVEARLEPKDAALLAAMGLRCHASVRVCRAGEPCIVSVLGGGSSCSGAGNCRIGLARPLAEKIFIKLGPG